MILAPRPFTSFTIRPLIHQQPPEPAASPLGISAGAINAVFLSTFEKGPGPFQDAIKQLRTLWLSLKNSDVYKNSPLGPFRTQSIYNTEPLRATLKRFLSSRPQPLTVERGVTIGTSDLASGMMKYVDAELLQTDPVGWAMASSAIPIAFEPQHINGSVFVDGGTLSNEIIAPGVKSCPADSEVEVDVILCSPRIGKLPPETVAKFGFGAVAGRVLEMVQQQLSNHVLDFRCDEDERSNVKVTLYQPTGDDNGISALDFTKASFIWNAGYNRSVVDEWYYCPVRGAPKATDQCVPEGQDCDPNFAPDCGSKCCCSGLQCRRDAMQPWTGQQCRVK